MVKGLYTAHTGMVNEMKRLDILANNLANADTTAYKKEGTTSRTFADEMSLRIKDSSNMGIPKKLGDITYGGSPWTGIYGLFHGKFQGDR